MGSKHENDRYMLSDSNMIEVGKAVAGIDAALGGQRSLSVDVVGINIKSPKFPGGEVLCVIKGVDGEGTPMVAFHSAFTLGEALRGVDNRIRNGSLKWRADQYIG